MDALFSSKYTTNNKNIKLIFLYFSNKSTNLSFWITRKNEVPFFIEQKYYYSFLNKFIRSCNKLTNPRTNSPTNFEFRLLSSILALEDLKLTVAFIHNPIFKVISISELQQLPYFSLILIELNDFVSKPLLFSEPEAYSCCSWIDAVGLTFPTSN